LHQADIAFLNQIADGQSIAAIASCDVHNETQVRQHELSGGAQVVAPAKTDSELALLLTAQHGNAADPLEISIDAADRAGQGEVSVTGDEGGASGHRVSWVLGGHSSTRVVRVLTAPIVPGRSTGDFGFQGNGLAASSETLQ